jgi:hypothetical protein
MDTNFSRDASSFTLMERGLGNYCLRAVLASCIALVMFTGPSLAWATGSHDKHRTSRHQLIDHQRIQDLRERISDLRERLKEHRHHQHNTTSAAGGTTAGSLADLQAKVTLLESSVAALLSADTTLLTTLQAAQAQIAALQAKIATMESSPTTGSSGIPDLDKYVIINPDVMNGVKGPHIIFRGVNVHVQSGSGSTADTTSGLGNLIVGYNEVDPLVGLTLRNGSHNLVGGRMNYFPSFGGAVFGTNNRISGQHAAILGGTANTASGLSSTVYGGYNNSSLTTNSFTPPLPDPCSFGGC